MKKYFKYELNLLKQYKVVVIIFFVALIVGLVLLYRIPYYSQVHSFGHPNGVHCEDMIAIYQQQLAEIYDEVGAGKYPLEYKESQIKTLELYISHGTCEYDYMYPETIFYRHYGVESLANGLSLLEGMTFINVFISVLISNYFISYPHSQDRIRQMIEIGGERKKIFVSKNIFGIGVLFTIITLTSIMALILLNPYFNQLVMMVNNREYSSIPLINIIMSRIIAMYLAGAFFFLISEVIALVGKRMSFSFFMPLVIFAFCFLCSTLTVPSWGYYGELASSGRLLLITIPFSNIVLTPSFGFVKEVVIILISYFVINIGLYFINRQLFIRQGF